MADSDVEHGCPQHMASVVGGEVEARLHLATGTSRGREGRERSGEEGRCRGGRVNRKELQRRKENEGDEEGCEGLNLCTVSISLSQW